MSRAVYEDDVIKLLNRGWKSGRYPLACDVRALPSAQSLADSKLRKIADLVEGSIDHFDRDDAMDLLYQIKEIVGNETSNIRG